MSLIADRNTPYKDSSSIGVPVGANAKIYSGALVAANATGFAVPGATATTLTYLGRAEVYVDNTGGADGAQTVTIRRNKLFKWANSVADPIDQSCLGKVCYIIDDQTVAKTNGTNTRSAAGIVLGIATDGVWVQ